MYASGKHKFSCFKSCPDSHTKWIKWEMNWRKERLGSVIDEYRCNIHEACSTFLKFKEEIWPASTRKRKQISTYNGSEQTDIKLLSNNRMLL